MSDKIDEKCKEQLKTLSFMLLILHKKMDDDYFEGYGIDSIEEMARIDGMLDAMKCITEVSIDILKDKERDIESYCRDIGI